MAGCLLSLLLGQPAHAQILSVPSRPADAVSGTEFAKSIFSLPRAEREDKIYAEVARGNVPDFLRKLVPIKVDLPAANNKPGSCIYYVTPDYLAIGSDDDYFLTPLSPIMAQKVADLVHCSLPTRKMVNDIYAAAAVKLVPSPIPPGPTMATVPVFLQHNTTILAQRKEQLPEHPLGALVAGHKKDVVIANKLQTVPGRVAIYGWHKPDGKPIQPLYTGHADTYADYSHGIRLVQVVLTVNGAPQTISQVLANPELSPLLSDEGPITHAVYPPESQSKATPGPSTGTGGATNEIK